MNRWHLAGFLALAVRATAEPTLAEADQLYRARRFAEAETAYRKLEAADPQRPEIAYGLGKVEIARGESNMAVGCLQRAVALAPGRSDYFLWLGNGYAWQAAGAPLREKIGLGRKCLAAYDRALELDPENLQAHIGRMNVYRHVPAIWGGGMTRAFAEAAEIGRHNPERGAFALAELHAQERDFPRAFAILDMLLARNPRNFAVNCAYGRWALASGMRLNQGESCLQRCMELTPTEDDEGPESIQWYLGQIFEARHDHVAARVAYQQCLRIHPDFGQAREALERLKPARVVQLEPERVGRLESAPFPASVRE